MQAQNSNLPYDSSFFQCYICMNNVKKPRMCPSCSKLACQNCLRKWIEDSRSECPHCRKVLPLASFADCQRFVNDIKHLISTMDSNQKTKEKCKQHKIQMQYYCENCKEAICSDCGMFGMKVISFFQQKHRGHQITHLSKIYQENKNKILNQLAKFDQKIESYRKKGFFIKLQTQKLMIQIGQKKSFIQEYFLSLMQRLEEEFRDKKTKLQNQHEENTHQIELLQAFRDQICHELESKTQKEVITTSDELIGEIHKLCDKEKQKDLEEEEYSFETMQNFYLFRRQEIVPKYQTFAYTMKNYLLTHEGITYSDPYIVNGIEWRLKIYPRGNGVAKDSHISVFLQMSKAYCNQNKYEYKIQLINHFNLKDSIIREYSSKFDIGECWGYNQFVPLGELENGFLNYEGSLNFNISVRNPTYKSLVRDQENYIKVLENKLKSNEQSPNLRNRQIISKLSRQSESHRQDLKKTLLLNNEEKQQLSSRNMFANQDYSQQKSLNDGTLSNKMNSLSLENVDNMAMLQADSVQDEYRIDSNNSHLSS